MDSQKLWRVWWLWGAILAVALGAFFYGAEAARDAGHDTWGDAIDVARLPLYWAWHLRVWKCATNVTNPIWTLLARAAALAGFVANAMV